LDERLARVTEQQAGPYLQALRAAHQRSELAAGVGDCGFPLWHKFTACTSEVARYEGQPVHRAIVRRLRPAGISGTTT
jgi:hypothetical protein